MTDLERLGLAAAKYAESLPDSSRDAPFIYVHRKGLARALLQELRNPSDGAITGALASMNALGVVCEDRERQRFRAVFGAIIDHILSEAG